MHSFPNQACLEGFLHPYLYIRKWVFPGRLCHFLISGGYFTVQGLISYVKFLKNKTRFRYKNLGQGPYGPGPRWAKAHMGQGPYGPRAPGPRALPCWANTSPENAPEKNDKIMLFFDDFKHIKRCATSVRSFWRRYRAEISAMCQKTKVSVFEKRPTFVRNLVRNLPSEFASEFALGICY